MSSVTRFLKQIQPNSPYFTANPSFTYWTYVPAPGNPTNYLPGTFNNNMNANIQAAITNATQVPGGGAILRDMGKTITSDGRVFHQVQVLFASGAPESTSNIPPNGTGGVFGAPNIPGVYNPYYTCYVEQGFGGLGLGGFGTVNNLTRVF